MKNSRLILTSFLSAGGVAVYTGAVSFVMNNGQQIFGKMTGVLAPVAFLLLFVLSAAITGGMVLGRPGMLYLEGHRVEAIKLFLYTLGWLFLMTLVAFAVLLFK